MKRKISREQMIPFLLETPFFENLEPKEILEIIHIVEVTEYEAGEIIFSEGDLGDSWFIVYRGAVDVLKGGEASAKKIAEIGSKNCFGEMSILDGLPRSATIRAAEDSIILCVKREVFGELIGTDNLVAYKILHQMAILLAGRQRTSNSRLSELLRATDFREIQDGVMSIVGENSIRE